MTTSEKNAETVRRGYAAFNSGDLKTLNEIFDENSTWHTPGKTSIAGDKKGRDATFQQFGRYATETDGTFKAILKSVAIGDDGRLVGIHHNTAERKGKKLDVDCCLTFEFKDGKVIDGREYFYNQQAWDEFWS